MGAKNPTNTYGWLSVPWVEHITRSGSTATYTLSPGQQQMAYTIRVKFDDWPQAVTDLMGYSYVAGAPAKLRREPAKAHPFLPWLRCVGIAQVVGVGPKKEPRIFDSIITDLPTGAMQDYEFAIITAHFSTVPYKILDDDELDAAGGKEYLRYTRKRFKPFVNLAVTEKGMFKFAEGPGGPPTPATLDVGLSRTIRKTVLTLDWMEVPWRALFDLDGYPKHLEEAVGRVNQFPFLGFPDYTLLCLPYEMNERMAGVSPTHVQLLNFDDPPLVYDVSLSFEIYEPDTGPTSGFAGHITVPYKLDGLNYLVSTDGTVEGEWLYRTYNFDKIFEVPL